ncbi:MAG: hypothetical protein J6M93_04360 [Succinivibrio sp.]|nr:hypothetical protein [Succinivibrio sp.]
MNRTIKYLVGGTVFLTVLYCAGVGVGAYYSDTLINDGLVSLNKVLEEKYSEHVLPKLSTKYVAEEKGFFSQKGNFLITNADSGQVVSLPSEFCHGFLSLKGRVDFYHFLNNLFLKKGVLDLHSEAYADVSFRLFPYDYSLAIKVDGPYAANYLKQDPKRLSGYSKKLHSLLRLHGGMTGRLDASFEACNVVTTDFTADRIFFNGVNIFNAETTKGNMQFGIKGMYAHNTFYDEVDDVGVSLLLDDDSVGSTSVEMKLELDTSRGKLSAEGVLGKFNGEQVKKHHGLFLDLLGQPLSFNRYFDEKGGSFTLKQLVFYADYTAPEGRVQYVATAKGKVVIPQADNVVISAQKINGNVEVRFDKVNQAAEKTIDSIGRHLFEKDAGGYVSKITIENGKLLYNGKEY